MRTRIRRRDSFALIAGGVAALASGRARAGVRGGAAVIETLGLRATMAELTLPPLPYALNALEPAIDTETMEIHHGRHHKAYVDNANRALAGTALSEMTPETILAKLDSAPEDKRTAIRNNVGGHVNHSMFWLTMAPAGKGGGGEPAGSLADAIGRAFGSFGDSGGFKEQFAGAAVSRFGSGWAWLCADRGGLSICSTANQDSPLMGKAVAGCDGTPILGLDVWEHAYYLKYHNRRADYIAAWWNIVHWPKVAELYKAATG